MDKHEKHKPVPQPVPVEPVASDADVAAFIQEMKTKEPMILAVLAERAEQLKEERDSRKKLEEIKANCEKSALERTQAVVDKLYSQDASTRWQVAIPEDKAQLTLAIPARTREEAIGKYNAVCGIRSTDHEYAAQPVA